MMTALIDWRDDASLPSRTLSWREWALAMALLAVVMAAVVIVVTGPVSNVATNACRLHEAREGIPDLDKIDVPAIGMRPAVGWVPPRGVVVRRVHSSDAAKGTVVDITKCGRYGSTDTLQVSIAR